MKTINYESKTTRQGALATLFVFAIANIIVLISSEGAMEILSLIILLVSISLLIGMIFGYILAMKTIKDKIISAAEKEEVKIATKGLTAISGKLIFITDGIKLKEVVLKKNSFAVETDDGRVAEKQVSDNLSNYTFLIGETPRSTAKTPEGGIY